MRFLLRPEKNLTGESGSAESQPARRQAGVLGLNRADATNNATADTEKKN